MIDGEAVWCDRDGLAIFDKLHSRAYDGQVILYAFELLEASRGRTADRGRSRSARHPTDHVNSQGIEVMENVAYLRSR